MKRGGRSVVMAGAGVARTCGVGQLWRRACARAEERGSAGRRSERAVIAPARPRSFISNVRAQDDEEGCSCNGLILTRERVQRGGAPRRESHADARPASATARAVRAAAPAVRVVLPELQQVLQQEQEPDKQQQQLQHQQLEEIAAPSSQASKLACFRLAQSPSPLGQANGRDFAKRTYASLRYRKGIQILTDRMPSH